MKIRCTQKMLSELKEKPVLEYDSTDPFWSWHANMFYIERHKCVLITNDITLFTLFIPALKKPDFQNFKLIFGQQLFKNLLHEKIPQNRIEIVLSGCEKIQYRKTNNRSVLGSMNNQRAYLEAVIQNEGGLERTDIFKLNHKLNRYILSPIGYNRPVEMFIEQLNFIG
ncbi:MAG: hypothetical protein K9L30_09750 [Desulfobacterales bacterium]|nr:hypothetical protein [Desulfobacterales bacterium]